MDKYKLIRPNVSTNFHSINPTDFALGELMNYCKALTKWLEQVEDLPPSTKKKYMKAIARQNNFLAKKYEKRGGDASESFIKVEDK